LTHAIGKSKAMELVLTGGKIDAKAAEKAGLVARIYPAEELVDEVVKVADKIAQLSTPIVMMAKEGVNKSFEMSLQEGLNYERLMFHSTFATVGLALGRKNPLPRSPPPAEFHRSVANPTLHSPLGLAVRRRTVPRVWLRSWRSGRPISRTNRFDAQPHLPQRVRAQAPIALPHPHTRQIKMSSKKDEFNSLRGWVDDTTRVL
jgi:hypothetical protein